MGQHAWKTGRKGSSGDTKSRLFWGGETTYVHMYETKIHELKERQRGGNRESKEKEMTLGLI